MNVEDTITLTTMLASLTFEKRLLVPCLQLGPESSMTWSPEVLKLHRLADRV